MLVSSFDKHKKESRSCVTANSTVTQLQVPDIVSYVNADLGSVFDVYKKESRSCVTANSTVTQLQVIDIVSHLNADLGKYNFVDTHFCIRDTLLTGNVLIERKSLKIIVPPVEPVKLSCASETDFLDNVGLIVSEKKTLSYVI